MPTPAPSRLDDQRHDYTSDASDFAGDYEQRGTITSAEVTSDKEQLVTKGKMSLPSQLIRAALFGLAIGVPAMATTNAGNANIYLYQQELGVDSASILRASLFSGLISTFSALLFGFYSDSIETRFGRRRPFVLAGALLQAASIYLLCSPSMDFSPEGAADYLLAVSVVQNVAADIFGLSVAAWAAEVTQSAGERALLFGVMCFLSVATGLIMPILVIFTGLSPQDALSDYGKVLPTAGFACVLLLCTVVISGQFPATKRSPMLPNMRACFSNRPWLLYMVAKICLDVLQLGMSEISFVLLYFYKVPVIPQTELFKVTNTITLLANIPGLLGAMCAPMILKRVDGKTAVMAGFGAISVALTVWAVAMFTADVQESHSLDFLYVMVVLVSCFTGLFAVALNVLGADCLDYDELQTLKRREGVYKALEVVPQQFINVALGGIPGVTLSFCGVAKIPDGIPGVTLPAGAPWPSTAFYFWSRCWCSIVPLAACLTAIYFVKQYPITSKVHAAIMELLRSKRGQASGSAASPEADFESSTDHQDRGRVLLSADVDPVTQLPLTSFGPMSSTGVTLRVGGVPMQFHQWLGYFSGADLLALSGGWKKRWMAKYAFGACAFTTYMLLAFTMGESTFVNARALGVLSEDSYRSLGTLVLTLGACFSLPVIYYGLQFKAAKMIFYQSDANRAMLHDFMRSNLKHFRASEEASELFASSAPSSSSGSEVEFSISDPDLDRLTTAPVVLRELVKHGLCIAVLVLMAVYVWNPLF